MGITCPRIDRGQKAECATEGVYNRRSGQQEEWTTGVDNRSGQQAEWTTGEVDNRRSGQQEEWTTGGVDNRRSGQQVEDRDKDWSEPGEENKE